MAVGRSKRPQGGMAVKQSFLAMIASGAIGALSAATLIGTACAQESATIKAGFLTCHAAQGFGYILGSSRALECTYLSKSGASESYYGSLSKVGIDVGYLGTSTLMWAVLAPANISGAGALAGSYAGATAGATVGVGGAINVMTGGFRNSIALQPISVEGSTGLYVGAGIAAMRLEPEDNDM